MKIDGQTDDCMTGWDGMGWQGVCVYVEGEAARSWPVSTKYFRCTSSRLIRPQHGQSSLSRSLSVNGEHFQPFMCVFRALF